MSKYKKILGKYGENIACNFLKDKGYTYIQKNFKLWGGEIDLIMKDPQTNEVVFIEVKTRREEIWQYLDETLSNRQLNNIKKIIPLFLLKHNLENSNWRIDHIGIIYKDKKIIKIEHFVAIG